MSHPVGWTRGRGAPAAPSPAVRLAALLLAFLLQAAPAGRSPSPGRGRSTERRRRCCCSLVVVTSQSPTSLGGVRLQDPGGWVCPALHRPLIEGRAAQGSSELFLTRELTTGLFNRRCDPQTPLQVLMIFAVPGLLLPGSISF